MAKKEELKQDAEGRYKRWIGWKVGTDRPIQHLFRLGRDEKAAKAATRRLEQLWECIVEQWKKQRREGTTNEPSPLWDDTTLAIGQAIAKGETVATIYPPAGMENMRPAALASWVAILQIQYPMIALKLPDHVKDAASAGLKQQAQTADNSRRLAEIGLNVMGETSDVGGALYAALDAYSAHVGETHRGKDRPQQLSIRLLRQHAEDVPLSKLNKDKINAWLAYWSRRPASKDTKKEAGTPLAETTCRNVLIVMRQFLRWLSESDAHAWTLPQGYSFPRQRIERNLPQDTVKKRRRRHWTVEELTTLWKYAKPWERALMTLALNCGFGKAEIATLQPCEIVKEKIKEKTYTFVKRDRRKTSVYGEWVLWDETLAALEYLKQFRKADSVYVVCNTEGGSLDVKTSGDNENQVIKNHWDNLFKRVREDVPECHKLPFKYLRKTAGNMVRHLKVDGAVELAVMFLAHGERMDGGDTQLAAYTDRPWRKLHKALFKLRRKLLPVFTSVEEPWEYTVNRTRPATVERIMSLRGEGKTLKAIAAEVGLHEMTVGKIVRRERKQGAES